MQIELIKPYLKNAKIHSKRQVEQIANISEAVNKKRNYANY